MHRLCRAFHCLPQRGSLEDQNPALLELIALVGEFHHEFEQRAERRQLAALLGLKR